MIQAAVAGDGGKILAAAIAPRLTTGRPWLFMLMHSTSFSAASKRREIFVGIGFGGRHDQKIRAPPLSCGIRREAGTPAITPFGRQRIHHRRGGLRAASG